MSHNGNRYFNIGFVAFWLHRLKPPDFMTTMTRYRPCAWLIVTVFLLLFCPQVRSNKWSVFDSFARTFAESLLSHTSELPRVLEGFELGYIRFDRSNPLSVVYNITPNNDSWIYITPCSNFKYVITLQSLISNSDSRWNNRTNTYIKGKGQLSEWYDKVTKVDMRLSSGLGESLDITNWKRQEIHVTNLKLGILRMHIKTEEMLPSVYMIRHYSGQIDGFYPRIPQDPSVQICITGTDSLILNIFVSRAYNTDVYCASFNLIEDLPNFCTAQLRIDKQVFDNLKKREKIAMHRSIDFDRYNRYSNIDPIIESEFRCFKKNIFQVALKNTFRKSPVYINIYALNTATEFTDSYLPVKYVWDTNQKLCDQVNNVVNMDARTPHLWVMGNETIFFNISINTKHSNPTRLLYQGCMSIQRESLEVYERKSQTALCREIPNSRVKSLCDPLRPGEYLLKHHIHDRSNFTMPIGQIFLSNNIRAFPHLYCNDTEDYSLTLHRLPHKNATGQYHLNVSFVRVSSPFEISYIFHILEFPTQANNNYTIAELMSQIRQLVRSERNFCQFNDHNKRRKLPSHTVTLKGRSCRSSEDKVHETAIPGLFNGSSTYALLVYFDRAGNRMPNVQFYSNVIFTVYNEEDVF